MSTRIGGCCRTTPADIQQITLQCSVTKKTSSLSPPFVTR
ncbi:homocysteine S-methyltransferase family protein [Secundilactobacillus yichangensis]